MVIAGNVPGNVTVDMYTCTMNPANLVIPPRAHGVAVVSVALFSDEQTR